MRKSSLFILALIVAFNTGAQLPQPSFGKVIRHSQFPSKYVQPRNIDVWLPADYNKDEKYAVIYMQDGQMLFDSAITWNHQEWKVDETMNDLISSKKVKPSIVVGIWNTGSRWQEYFPEKVFDLLEPAIQDSLLKSFQPAAERPFSNQYLSFIVNELKPFIDKEYSTSVKPRNTFIAGSSMGALISLYALCEYSNVFGGAACISTHWTGGTNERYSPDLGKAFNEYLIANLPSSTNHRIYFDFGTETVDKGYEPNQRIIDATMRMRGFSSANWITQKFPGDDHSERSWSKRFSQPMIFLLPKQQKGEF
jgi:enterochelin esterase-like enzyme